MNIIGLMSGTSLDGLDVALCCFESAASDGSGIRWQLLAAETYPYDDEWTLRLASLDAASAYDYALTHVQLGHYFGQRVQQFLSEHPLPVDAIASHGHTVFHQPHLLLTSQIGDGNAIAAETTLPVVNNFRALDVALGGQGAPLVPVGDRLLFPDYEACLNLGGFSNISFDDTDGVRRAFDISPCNFALNALARRVGVAYDRDGMLAASGNVNESLLAQMDALEYYRRPIPKSLGKEWYISDFEPLISTSDIPVSDLLRTVVEHVARQVATVLEERHIHSLLATGGGARNTFLMSRIAALSPHCRVSVPESDIVDYKEAIIFALLGYLRLTGQVNTYASVTGASVDSCGGEVTNSSAAMRSANSSPDCVGL